VDELKRILHEEPAALAEPGRLEALVDDIPFMLGRMEERLGEYRRFRDAVLPLADELRQIGASLVPDAGPIAAALKAQLSDPRRGPPSTGERDVAVAQAEALRDIAQDVENKLNRYKELALALARAYRDVKGSRLWVLDEAEAATAALPGEPQWARWLPPSPHRERIVRWMQSGRAHLVPPDRLDTPGPHDAPDAPAAQPPLVQFQDGGVMRLPDVRWSEDVRSFYSSEMPPDPRGRLYRDYEGRRVFPAGQPAARRAAEQATVGDRASAQEHPISP
jgi:hypothetical protein